jgi:DNA polymerase alpha subunit A
LYFLTPATIVASQTHFVYGHSSKTPIAMPSARERLAELKALRASGKKRIDTYEVEEQGDIYEEVDDDGYKKIIRDRLDEDDFVVDDNGAGYADDGREVWNERTAEYDSDDSDELPAQSKAAKRKREEEKQRKEKINNGISKYFNSGTSAASAPKPKVSSFLLRSAHCTLPRRCPL